MLALTLTDKSMKSSHKQRDYLEINIVYLCDKIVSSFEDLEALYGCEIEDMFPNI